MPLHVNLYHEIQRQEKARRLDPLRLGMLAVLIIAIVSAVDYFVILERAHVRNNHYADLQDEWAKLQAPAKEAKNQHDKLSGEMQASDAVVNRIESRFYWAPVFGDIVKTVPRTVQLTHLGGEAPGDPAPNAPVDDKPKITVISVSGASSGIEPRKEAEALRTAITAKLTARFKNVTSEFKQLEDSEQFAMLDGRRLPIANFAIEFRVQIGDAPAATPPPGPKIKK